MGISNPKLKSMGMAFGASAIAAIGTMFLPVALLEGMTGATGLSELVPATAAPLGDTARALIAFGTGAFTLAVMAILLLRKDRDVAAVSTAPIDRVKVEPEASSSRNPAAILGGLKERLMNFKVPQMPWAKNGDDDILDLADLPKLRSMDAHPDAPARRPFSAGSDLDIAPPSEHFVSAPEMRDAVSSDLRFWPEHSDEEPGTGANREHVLSIPVADRVDEWSVAAEEVSPPLVASEWVAETVPDTQAAQSAGETVPSPAPSMAAPVQTGPSLDDLVNQLERAVTLRQQQLSALEMVAAQIKSETTVVAPEVAPEIAAYVTPVVEQPVAAEEPAPVTRSERPTLEAVPTSQRKMADEDMDAALNAALETLQRMNAQGR